MTTISSNQAETHAVHSKATYQRRQLVQTTITGETHNPLPQHNKRRHILQNTESQNVFQLKRLTQSNLQGEHMAAKDSESFRDTYPPNPGKNKTIITFQNIGPQRFSLYHQTSVATSRAFKDSEAGIALYAECSLIGSLLPAGNGFNNKMRILSPNSFSRLTNNTNERHIATWNQRGGAAFTVQNNIKSHQTSHGTNKSGLGGWIWTRLCGKGTSYTRLVSAYRPCNNKGIGTVWTQQHCRYLRTVKQIAPPDPIRQFDTDLIIEIQKWKMMGDNIIIGIDMNEDIRTCILSKVFKENNL
jgi:hypothetical protein